MRHNQVEEDLSQFKDLPPAKSLARIRSKYPTLAASEARVATWVLQQPESIMHLSMAQVAQACGVSDTTVLRFCRNSGFQGYTDLKLSIARDLTNSKQLIHDDIVEGDTPIVMAQKVFISKNMALYDTKEVLEEEVLTKDLVMLSRHDNILLSWVGTTVPIVNNTKNKLISVGHKCRAHTE